MVTREEQKIIRREGHKRERAAGIQRTHKARIRRPRGRPLGWRKSANPEPRTTIQVYKSFKEMLDLERQIGETNADTITRLFSALKKEIRTLKGDN
jgi:hypothetical protein